MEVNSYTTSDLVLQHTDVISLMSEHGKFKRKPLFGVSGLYIDDILIFIECEDELFVRDNELTKKLYGASGTYMTFGGTDKPKIRYRLLDDQCNITEEKLKKSIKHAYSTSKAEKEKENNEERIRYLPNMQFKTESLLAKSGITSVSQLKALGAVRAYHQVQECNKNVQTRLLLMLEGALKGCAWQLIPETKKNELLSDLRRLF
ncbi:TfoX/Sxy family DNA transformation protein [Vibrio mediterranei]|uniref:TfoX/Sxy family DNA transformation protein n=1 Tax=Vibrio mediterranei TaxID=689 RepID=UPI004067E406